MSEETHNFGTFTIRDRGDGYVEIDLKFDLPIRDSDAIAKRLIDYGISWRNRQEQG